MVYYLNIDPVPDPDGDMVYPLDISALGTCGTETATVKGLCSEGTDPTSRPWVPWS